MPARAPGLAGSPAGLVGFASLPGQADPGAVVRAVGTASRDPGIGKQEFAVGRSGHSAGMWLSLH